jgi:hypothetical protein
MFSFWLGYKLHAIITISAKQSSPKAAEILRSRLSLRRLAFCASSL